jgi:hypothetical protein
VANAASGVWNKRAFAAVYGVSVKNRRIAVVKISIAAAFAVLMLAGADSAMAQRYTNYPFCAVYGGRDSSPESCAFNTMSQCQMSVSGRGGYCLRNVDYRPQGKRRIYR